MHGSKNGEKDGVRALVHATPNGIRRIRPHDDLDLVALMPKQVVRPVIGEVDPAAIRVEAIGSGSAGAASSGRR
jgi:hypothetical protein